MRKNPILKSYILAYFLFYMNISLLAEDGGTADFSELTPCSELTNDNNCSTSAYDFSCSDSSPYYCSKPSCYSNHFNISAEWLSWKVRQDGLRAATFINDFPSPTLKIAKSSNIQPKFKRNDGLRASFGYDFFCDLWELKAIYTYVPLQSKPDFKKAIPLNEQTDTHRQYILPNVNSFPSFQAFSAGEGLTAFTSLLAKWHGHLSYVDIDLARKLTFNRFQFKPHIGFRTAWMKQHLSMKGGLLQPSTNNSNFGILRFEEKLNGFGIEGGAWANWQLGKGFSLVGHISGSILYSYFQVEIISESSIEENGPVVFIINAGGKEITAIPTMDYFIGLQHESLCGNFLIAMRFGWEQRLFFDMNQMSINGGNLSLQGLTLGANVRF